MTTLTLVVKVFLNTLCNFLCLVLAKMFNKPIERQLIIFTQITRLASGNNVLWYCAGTIRRCYRYIVIFMQYPIAISLFRSFATIGASVIKIDFYSMKIGMSKGNRQTMLDRSIKMVFYTYLFSVCLAI